MIIESTLPQTGTPAQLKQRDDFRRNVWCLMGIPIDAVTINETSDLVRTAAKTRERLSFVTPNVNWLVSTWKNPEMRRLVIDADLSVIDGAPLVAMAKRLGLPITERVAGSDLYEHLEQSEEEPLTVFFFGGREGAAKAAHEKTLQDETRALRSVGWLNPGFGDIAAMSTPDKISAINKAAPQFIVVALGAAKGQKWIDHNAEHLNAPAIAHLGAVVDFTAGTVKRTPPWIAKAGFEWLWRIFAEPSLWKRYAKDAMSLAGLLSFKFLPQKLNNPQKSLPDAKTFSFAMCTGLKNDPCVIKLKGTLIYNHLHPVRAQFRKAANLGEDVILDFKDVIHIDLAFLGQCLMLEKHLTRHGKSIRLQNLTPAMRKNFLRNQMDYKII